MGWENWNHLTKKMVARKTVTLEEQKSRARTKARRMMMLASYV